MIVVPPVAVLSALAQEQQGLIAQLDQPECVRYAGRDFWCGRLLGQRVVLALSRVGKVAAATTAAALIERFGCTRIVFTGVAGGVGDGVQVGDVVRLLQGSTEVSRVTLSAENLANGWLQLQAQTPLTGTSSGRPSNSL